MSFLRYFSKLFSFTQELAIDLGTANTIIISDDEIVVNEPSVVALDRHSERMIAVGEQAKLMYEKTNDKIRVIRPLRDGVIADFNACEQMMRGLINMVHRGKRLFSPSLRMVIGVPSGSTEVELRAVRDSAEHAGGRDIFLLFEPMAAAIGERLGLTAAEIAAGTAAYAPVGSRMHLIRMDGDRLVIDDCYNANPQSIAEGIRMLAASRQKKRLAVLGDMGELGALTAQAHRDMGTLCRELGIETVAVGEKMKALTETDPEAQWFAGVEEAMPAVRARFTTGTAVLVKASHAMHFGNIVKELEKE